MKLRIRRQHEWFVASFSYATWTECACGYRPQDQNDMDNHYPTERQENR